MGPEGLKLGQEGAGSRVDRTVGLALGRVLAVLLLSCVTLDWCLNQSERPLPHP
jgi:hypothetical protein